MAVFHPRQERPTAGFIELFGIERTATSARIMPTGMRMPTARGPHDLVVIPERRP
jgi:hypothetical protein